MGEREVGMSLGKVTSDMKVESRAGSSLPRESGFGEKTHGNVNDMADVGGVEEKKVQESFLIWMAWKRSVLMLPLCFLIGLYQIVGS